MPGPMNNEGHERFAQELAKGTAQHAAWLKAGFKGGEAVASRAAKRPDVRARIDEILSRAAVRAETTVADIARQLDEDRKFARKLKQAGPAVSASMGKAKVLGLIIEQRRHSFDFSNLNDEDLETLESILAKTADA